MAKKSVAERLEEHKKNRANGGSNTTTASSSTRTSVADRLDRHKLERSVNLDTFESDLSNVNTTLSSVLGGWQTQETMQNARTAVESMYKRTNDYQTYIQKYQPDTKVNLGDLSSYFEDVLGNWDGIASTYGRYKDADSYTKETTKLKELTSMTKEELASHLKDKNSIAYTTYGGQDITWQSLFDEKDHAERATSKEGAEGWKKYLADTEGKKGNNAGGSFLDILVGSSPVYDMTTAGGVLSQVVHDKRQDKSYQNPTDKWTDEERNIFGSYYLEDPEKAHEYAVQVNNAKLKAMEDEQRQMVSDSATSGGWAGAGHSVGALLTAPMAIADYMNDLTDMVAGRPIMSDGVLSPFEYSQEVQGSISNKLNEYGTINEKVPVLGGKGLGDVYGGAMSIAQSTLHRVALGSIGTLASYFGQGASAGIDEQLRKGASDTQAMLYGTTVGALEGALEALVGDKVSKIGASGALGNFFAKLVGQGKSEALEEGLTTVFSNIADGIIMKDKSAFMNAVRTYKTNNADMSDGEAYLNAFLDIGEDAIYDALMGFVSGATQGGAQIVKTTYDLGNTVRGNDRMEDLGSLASEVNGDAYKKYIDLIESGKINNLQLGSLAEMVSNQTYSDYESAIKNDVMRSYANKANELGDSKNSGLIASAVQKKNAGERLTSEEKAVLKTDAGQAVLKHGADIKLSNEFDNAFAKVKRTDSVFTPKTAEEKAKAEAMKKLKTGEKTVNAEGNEVTIEGVKTENGATTIQTSQGEVLASEMTFSSSDAEIVSYAQNMSAEKADLFVKMYDGKMNVDDYATSFDLAYSYGENKMDLSNALRNRGVLTEAQALKAYEAGNVGRAIAKQKAVDEINAKYSGKTFIEGKFDDSIIDYNSTTSDGSKVNWNSLTTKQRNALTFLKTFAKVTGVNIQLITSKTENGHYNPKTNTISIDVFAGRISSKVFNDAIVPTLSHEVTHWMKAKAPAMYAKIEDLILNTLAEKGKLSVDDLIANEKKRMQDKHPDMKVTDELAIDELVARGSEDMLANSELVREMLSTMSESEQKTFVDKVKETFQNIIEWVNALLNQYKSDSYEAEVLREFEDRMKELSKLWDEALAEAIKTNQSMKAEGITDKKLGSGEIQWADKMDDDFNIDASIEQTEELIAVHNLSEEKLLKTIQLGAFPMPSIAITKASIGHKGFGNISLLFRKDTIDPQFFRSNRVYSGDAWTPTYPHISYKANEKVVKKVRDKYYELLRKFGDSDTRAMYRYGENLEDTLNRDGGEKAMLDYLYEDTSMMQIYLQDAGKERIHPIEVETRTEITEAEAEMYKFFIDALGADLIAEYETPQGMSPMTHRKAFHEKYQKEIEDAYKRLFVEHFNFTDAEMENVTFNLYKKELITALRGAYQYSKNNGVSVKVETDTKATNEAIRKASADGYKKWVDNLFKGVEEKRGIRNNKDVFTSGGNRRSWETLHYEETLENVIKSMKEEGEKGIGGLGGNIFGASATSFDSIDSIRKAGKGIRKVSQEEFDDMKHRFMDRFFNLANSVVIHDTFLARDSAGETFIEAVSKFKTRAGIANYLKKAMNGWANYSEQVVDDLIALVNDIRNMPVSYFEAKPLRAVGFDEVAYAVIPDNASEQVRTELDRLNIPMKEYTAGDEDARVEAVNSIEGIQFSDKDYEKPIVMEDVNALRSIGRKSINDFTDADIKKAEKWAYKFYKELGVKSPFFRAWFGDWRAFDKTPLEIIQIDANSVFKTGNAINTDTGEKLSWNGEMQKESKLNASKDNKSDVEIIVANIAKVVEKGILLDTTVSTKTSNRKLEGTSWMHSFYSAVQIGNRVVLVKLYAENVFSEKQGLSFTRAYELKHIKKIAEFDGGVLIRKDGLTESHSTISINSVSDLFEFVKGNDKEFHPNDVNPAMLNEDGTPKVMYHGTNSEFEVFDISKNKVITFGNGFYFGENKELVTEHYAKNGGKVINAYLNIKNPFVIKQEELTDIDSVSSVISQRLGVGKVVKETIMDTLKSHGYDGVHYARKDTGNDVWVAYESAQIKSTSNIGTFNGEDENIQYSDRDSKGNQLTEAQAEFFKDSKIRNKKGNLLVVYHGTNSNFNTFKRGDVGYHFGNKTTARTRVGYGKNTILKEVYLNITNPIVFDEDLGSWDADHRLAKELVNRGIITEEEFYNVLLTDDKKYRRSTERSNSKLREVLLSKGYDGIVYSNTFESNGSDSYIAFKSSQIKEIANTNPTENEDIRYSDRDNVSVYELMGENESLQKQNAELQADVERLKERLKLEKKLTNGNVFDEKKLDAVARHLLSISKSDYSVADMVEGLRDVYSYIVESPQIAWDDLYAKAYDVARNVLAEQREQKVENDYFKMILNDIRKTKIRLSEQQVAEAKHIFGDDYHKKFFGRIALSKDGIDLDSKWQEWSSMYPDIFDAEITPADQVTALYDIYDSVRDSAVMFQKYNDEESIRALATEIYNQYWNVSTIRTTADKYDKEIKRLNFEHRNAMKRMRDNFKESIDKQKLADRIHYGKIINDVRNRKEAEIQRAKELGKKRVDAYKEQADRNALIQKITAKSLTLSKWMIDNSKKSHVPDVMKPIVRNFLDAIDFSSKQLLGISGQIEARYTPTKKDLRLEKALSKVHRMMLDSNNGLKSDKGDYLGAFFPEDLVQEIGALVERVEDFIPNTTSGEYVLNQMSVEDLRTLDYLVSVLKNSVTNMNKFFVAKHNEGIADLAMDGMEYRNKLGVGKEYGEKSLMRKIQKTLNWNNVNPFFAFKRYGADGAKIFEAFQDGWDKFAFNVKKIIKKAEEIYTKEEIAEWRKDIKRDIEISGGRKLTMTVPQIMSLYELQKREQARKHIVGEDNKGKGIRIGEIEDGKKIINQTEGTGQLTQNDIDRITGLLTPRQKAVADALQEFMSETGAEWGNEVTMKLYGFKGFGEANYFPIKTDENVRASEAKDNENDIFRLLNMSFTKSINENANNRIMVLDIFDVFAQHTSDMAKYNALALPVYDAFRWYSFKENTNNNTYSVKTSLETAFGKDGKSYIYTFLKDINGAQNVGRDALGSGFLTKAKLASVGANLKVVLLQPTSYARANAVIDTKYLIQAFGRKPKFELAEEYCGIAQWKSLGFYDTNIQKGVAEIIMHDQTKADKLAEASMKGAGKMDEITIGYLWNACEAEVRDKQKNFKDEKEFYKAVGLRLREVIYSTQVVDSTMTRSQLMRSPDRWDKIATNFMSEPTLSYNMLHDAYMDYALAVRETGSKEKAFKRHGKKVAKTITAYTVTSIVTALLEAGFDAFRDDEEELTADEFLKFFLQNFGDNMSLLGKIPYVSELRSVLQGYNSSRMDTQWAQYAKYTINGVRKLWEGEGNPYTTAKNAIRTFSYASGLPFYNVYRDLVASFDSFGLISAEELEEMFNEVFGDIFPSLKIK